MTFGISTILFLLVLAGLVAGTCVQIMLEALDKAASRRGLKRSSGKPD